MASIHRIIRTILLIGILSIFFCTFLAVGGYFYLNAPPRTFIGESISFEVHKGESAMSVGKRLQEKGIIKDRRFWYLLSRLEKNHIKAGIYDLQLPATQRDIHAMFLEGAKPILQRVTIPEGVTLKKIAQLLDNAAICSEEDFLAAASDREILEAYNIPGETMEGFLFPDTYLFPHNYPANLVVKAMADTFFRRLVELYPSALDLSPEELFKKVTLASIVEREYRISDEASIMAGVFYNRLNIKMPLQSCATVEYVITEILGKPHPKVIYTRDTQIKNPYNTYMVSGLPPGPISAPGIVALNAVFNPTKNEYLYFRLIDSSAGKHYFSKTYDDHIKAGTLYVKGS